MLRTCETSRGSCIHSLHARDRCSCGMIVARTAPCLRDLTHSLPQCPDWFHGTHQDGGCSMTETEKAVDIRSMPPALRLQALALALFDQTDAAHDLPVHARRLLQLAAAYNSAARHAAGERPDRVGRDLALAAPIPDLSPDDQAIVAGVVALQRAKVRPQREPVFPPSRQAASTSKLMVTRQRCSSAASVRKRRCAVRTSALISGATASAHDSHHRSGRVPQRGCHRGGWARCWLCARSPADRSVRAGPGDRRRADRRGGATAAAAVL